MPICVVICGDDSWVAIQTYAQNKQDRLKQFLELPNGRGQTHLVNKNALFSINHYFFALNPIN